MAHANNTRLEYTHIVDACGVCARLACGYCEDATGAPGHVGSMLLDAARARTRAVDGVFLALGIVYTALAGLL